MAQSYTLYSLVCFSAVVRVPFCVHTLCQAVGPKATCRMLHPILHKVTSRGVVLEQKLILRGLFPIRRPWVPAPSARSDEATMTSSTAYYDAEPSRPESLHMRDQLGKPSCRRASFASCPGSCRVRTEVPGHCEVPSQQTKLGNPKGIRNRRVSNGPNQRFP
jgi:hypothetical protein